MGSADITVYFNPRCSKCRQAAELLDDRGIEFDKRDYLNEPPDRPELESLSAKLGTDDPRVFMRSKEAAYAEQGLAGANRDQLLDAITAHPVLLERPIVVRGGRALIARPPERLLDLL